jgi:NADH-quinone oxidoreductase subunit C
MESCSCRSESGGQGLSYVGETTQTSPASLSAAERLALAAAELPDVTGHRVEYGEAVIDAERDALPALMAILRNDPRFAFEQVMDICGVDWPDREERFDVVYNLLSVSLNQRLRVIVRAGEQTPIPSVHSLWPSATWWEREAWDMYGIVFSGQPDLRRILTDYGFEGFPLRKDFPLTGYVEVRYDEERKQVVYEPVKLTQDWRHFDFISPWEGVTTLPGDEKVHQQRAQITRTPPRPPPEGKVPSA